MKKVSLVILAFMGVLSMSACGENKQENREVEDTMPMQNDTRMPTEGHEGHDGEQQQGNLDDGAQTGDLAFKDETKRPVYEHYMHIKTALVNTNAEEARSGAEMLMEALGEVENATQAESAARAITEADNINAQRTAFLGLSDAMEDMMTGALESGQLYKQYCPMAFDGDGGSWLSASEEIRNPYYGDKMLKCGSVRETIQ